MIDDIQINADLFASLSSHALFRLMELPGENATQERMDAQMALSTLLAQTAIAWRLVDKLEKPE